MTDAKILEMSRMATDSLRECVIENEKEVEELCNTFAKLISGKKIVLSVSCMTILIAHLIDAMSDNEMEKEAFTNAVAYILKTAEGNSNFALVEESRVLN
jgi:LPS O-antigen subunit length determinant protein (WzzB/FepE family)